MPYNNGYISGVYMIHQQYATFGAVGLKTFNNQDAFFVSKDGIFKALEGTTNVGNEECLIYYDENNNPLEVYNEHDGWLDSEYQYLSFPVPTYADPTNWDSFMQYHMTDSTQYISGWKVAVLSSIMPSKSLLYIPSSSFMFEDVNGNTYTRMLFDTTDGIYYNDTKVYDINDGWLDDSYKKIKFKDNTPITPTLATYFTHSSTSKWRTGCVVTFERDGLVEDVVIFPKGLAMTTASLPYQVNTIVTMTNNDKYQVDGYYSTPNLLAPSKLSFPRYITSDVTFYIKFLKLLEVDQRYYIDHLTEEATYVNMAFEYRNGSQMASGIRTTLNNQNIEIEYLINGTWTLVKQNGWINDDYRYIYIMSVGYLALQLDLDIISNGGSYLHILDHVTNITGVTIPANKWCRVLTNNDLPTLTPTSPYAFGGWYYDSLFTRQAQVHDPITEDTILYAKIYLPSASEIFLYQNKDVNNAIDKNPTLIKTINGDFRNPFSITNPVVDIELGDNIGLEFNYCYIPDLQRYYYVVDSIFMTKTLRRVSLKVDVLMSFKDQIRLNKTGIVKRNEYDYDEYIDDERMVLKPTKEKLIIESKVSNPLKHNTSSQYNYVLIGVK